SATARSRNSGQLGEIFRSEPFRRTPIEASPYRARATRHPGRAVSERIHFYLWRVHPSSARRGIVCANSNSFTRSSTAATAHSSFRTGFQQLATQNSEFKTPDQNSSFSANWICRERAEPVHVSGPAVESGDSPFAVPAKTWRAVSFRAKLG